MNLKHTFRLGLAVIAVLGGNLLAPAPSQAQMGGGPPPAMMAKIKKWQKWSETHKNCANLGDLIGQLSEMDKMPGFALNKGQATKVMALIRPAQDKKELSEDEAKSLTKAITNVLTTKQLQKIATIVPASKKWGRGGGGGGGMGGGRPAGGPPKGGAPGGFNLPDPPKGGYNPLNPDTFPMEMVRPRLKAGMNDFMTGLKNAK